MTDILEYLYATRGLETDEQKSIFLKPDFERDTHDPFLLSDMEEVVLRIRMAQENNEIVGIYTDYDCDGIPGAVILSDFLEKIGISKSIVYIPDRHTDGYGLAQKGIDFLIEKGASLIITIDLGITGFDGAIYCKEKKVDLIITDHHLPHEKLPQAYAIINPKKENDEYPFKELCGSGVVFKIIQAYIQKYGVELGIQPGYEKWFLDMVGLATLSDMVPLVGENRAFAYFGLVVMKKTKKPGLLALYKNAGIKTATLSEDDITHTVTPRLNAASRMGDVFLAYNLLKTQSYDEAEILVKALTSLNNSRKSHVARIMKEVYDFPEHVFKQSVVVVGSPKWRPGVLGLVAAKLVEEYAKPVFVWGGGEEEENDTLKGSCRGYGNVSLVDIMHGAQESFIHYGGHTGAGGFAVSKKEIYDLQDTLSRIYDGLLLSMPTQMQTKNQDANPTISFINEDIYSLINQFAPFGLGNEKPVIRFENVVLKTTKLFGKSSEHLECIFDIGGREYKAISFFKKQDSFNRELTPGDMYTIMSHIEKSYFFRPELRLRLIDIY